jgi:hypothetical protein
MKVAFFIGHHKTGSTSLQNYLANNYLTLLRQGILYPAVESEGITANLATVLRGQDSIADPWCFNQREPHNALSFRILHECNDEQMPSWHPDLPNAFQMLNLIEKQIQALQPQQVILCSEIMSRFAGKGTRKIMPRIANRFARHDCTIVLNLRRIDEYISSWHLQRLKFGHPIAPLRHGAQSHYYPLVHFRYDRIVEDWMRFFPQARMVARNYDDVKKAGGSVVDFFVQAGITPVPDAADQMSNSSIPHSFAEIARMANVRAPDLCHALQAYIQQAMERVTYLPNSNALLAAFESVHNGLSSALSVEAFFPDLEAARICREVPEMDAARAALEALRRDAPEHCENGAVRDFLANVVLED